MVRGSMHDYIPETRLMNMEYKWLHGISTSLCEIFNAGTIPTEILQEVYMIVE